MTSVTTRDRILDALRDLLVEAGSPAVTLEAVAARAEVSKGGLLYHFPSKQALLSGLVERLVRDAECEFDEAERNPDGVTPVYLRTSLPTSSEEAALYWSLVAALRSQELASSDATRLIHEFFVRWSELLHADIGDPVLAETIRLVGDGLYLGALAGVPQPDEAVLREVIDRLTAQADQARHQAAGAPETER